MRPRTAPSGLRPTPAAVVRHLGAGSDFHRAARATLHGLLARYGGHPAVQQRCAAWAGSMEATLGSGFEDDDGLFVAHTLLVHLAAAVAHAVLGDGGEPPSTDLLSEEAFRRRGIDGFTGTGGFDWIAALPGGEEVVETLVRGARAFDWSTVEHDVLKALYESMIPRETRKGLGEYYTPDWLAEAILEQCWTSPLEQRLVDPACGSGTFLFHAVRRYLGAADREDVPAAEALQGATARIAGVELHPVPALLARVTFLLALGRERLTDPARPPLVLPIRQGDALLRQEAETAPLPADLLVGNPPWLSYRHMAEADKAELRRLSGGFGLWTGGHLASQQDLAAPFLVRCVQLHLREAGRFAFVVPSALLDRPLHEAFRSGDYREGDHLLRIAFSAPWDLRGVRPHPFPRSCGVVFGRRRAEEARPMPATGERWEGRVPGDGPSWCQVEPALERRPARVRLGSGAGSPYGDRFRNGATVYPRALLLVEEVPTASRNGLVRIRTARSAHEKAPWSDLERRQAVVERDALVPVLLGECVLPYRLLPPRLALLPLVDGEWAGDGSHRLADLPHLENWWSLAEADWRRHRTSDRLTLAQRVDFHGGVRGQLPPAGHRVVYTKSGTHLATARIPPSDTRDHPPLVDHTLYWAEVRDEEEAHYLCAILNCPGTTVLLRPRMSHGKDPRHVDKQVWQLAIPEYDPRDPLHRRLAELGAALEAKAAALALDERRHFVGLRQAVRSSITNSSLAAEIAATVDDLLS